MKYSLAFVSILVLIFQALTLQIVSYVYYIFSKSQKWKLGTYIVLYISILILNLQLATPNYIEAQIPKKFKLGQEISDNAALWEIYEIIGETSNRIFPQENDGLKRIRNSLRILKRSSKQHPFPYDDLPLNLGMDFFLNTKETGVTA